MCDDNDPCTVWTETQRTARKTWKCIECRTEIKPGQKYVDCTSLYEGEWSRDRICLPCRAKWEALVDHGRVAHHEHPLFCFGGLHEHLSMHDDEHAPACTFTLSGISA